MAEAERSGQSPLKPSQCRNHLRKAVAGAYRDIVEGFIKQAKAGGCQHLKMATEIVGPKQGGTMSRGKDPAVRYLEKLEREMDAEFG